MDEKLALMGIDCPAWAAEALRNPSDELIERLSLVYHNDSLRTYAEQMRSVLAALADEFGVTR